jgi:hypothetical protein
MNHHECLANRMCLKYIKPQQLQRGSADLNAGQVATGPGPIAVQEPKSRPDTWTSVIGQGRAKLQKKRHRKELLDYNWLVVYLPLWKIWKSVGIMMTFPIYGKKMFQTTNQIRILRALKHLRTSTDINIKYHQIWSNMKSTMFIKYSQSTLLK